MINIQYPRRCANQLSIPSQKNLVQSIPTMEDCTKSSVFSTGLEDGVTPRKGWSITTVPDLHHTLVFNFKQLMTRNTHQQK